MESRNRNRFWMAAALAGAAILGTSAPARANLVLTLQEDSGSVTTINVPNNQGPANFTGTIGDFVITASFADSNSPGTGASALAENSTFKIVYTNSGTHTLHVNVSAQGFNTPNSPPPLSLTDSVSGTLLNGNVSGDYQGFADATNTLFGTGTPATKLTFAVSGASKSISADGTPVSFSPNGATYSLSIFSNYTFKGASTLTVTGGNVQAMPTPEPATAVAAIVGVGFFGGLNWLRRRRSTKA